MPNKNYYYETNCTVADGDAIGEMVDSARAVTYETVRAHVGDFDRAKEMLGYTPDIRRVLTLKKDWHVSFYKGKYQGVPCYFIVHSCIEYVFTLRGQTRDC